MMGWDDSTTNRVCLSEMIFFHNKQLFIITLWSLFYVVFSQFHIYLQLMGVMPLYDQQFMTQIHNPQLTIEYYRYLEAQCLFLLSDVQKHPYRDLPQVLGEQDGPPLMVNVFVRKETIFVSCIKLYPRLELVLLIKMTFNLYICIHGF